MGEREFARSDVWEDGDEEMGSVDSQRAAAVPKGSPALLQRIATLSAAADSHNSSLPTHRTTGESELRFKNSFHGKQV